MADSEPVISELEKTVEQRATDAKFYLTIGGGGFILITLLLLIPAFFIPLPPNITSSLLIAGLCYLVPGFILYLWGFVKVFRGKDLTLRQVLKARIERKDVRKTGKLIIFVSFFAGLLILPFLVGMSPLDLLWSVINYSVLTFGSPGLYIGLFIISLFGNFTVLFPVPYLFVLLFIAVFVIPNFTIIDGLVMGLVAGSGATIGEIVSWLLGRTQSEALEDSATGQRILKVREQVERGYGGFLIFFYAATPLPDDLLLIALGATRYPLWKTVIFCFLGKVALCLAITVGALNPFVKNLLLEFFGGLVDPLRETLYVVVGLIIIVLIFLVPWGSIYNRLFKRDKPQVE